MYTSWRAQPAVSPLYSDAVPSSRTMVCTNCESETSVAAAFAPCDASERRTAIVLNG